MEIRFGHDMANNYIMLNHSQLLLHDYKLHMLQENEIEGLLKMCVTFINGKTELTYTISSKQTISELYEKKKMNFKEAKEIILSFIQLCHQLPRYLLRMEDVLLEKDLVFLDYQSGKTFFCYYPDSGRELCGSVRSFIQELSIMTDHGDQKAVELVYGVLHICDQPHFLIADMEEFLKVFPDENRIDQKTDEPLIGEEWQQSIKLREEQPEYLLSKCFETGGDREQIESKTGLEQEKKEKKEKNYGLLKTVKGLFEKKLSDEFRNQKIITQEKQFLQDRAGSQEKDELMMRKKQQYCEDTMYIREIMEYTCRKLMSLTEKEDIELSYYPFVIGKLNERVDYVLEDRSVSRIHLRFSREGEDRYYMEDMNSKNGTFLNGIRVEPYEKVRIEPGDKIGIAAFEYIFR